MECKIRSFVTGMVLLSDYVVMPTANVVDLSSEQVFGIFENEHRVWGDVCTIIVRI